MNYRHAFHAGNFADVLKHIVLTRVLAYMALKPQPFRVIDTHAGAGLYDLNSEQARRTGEWRDGIARLRAADLPPHVAGLVQPYVDAVTVLGASEDGDITRYPGSPLIARNLMRRGDTLVANELHADDFQTLRAALANAVATKVMNLDAWVAIKSLLPPKERRGVVLIDPPFEQADEFAALVNGIDDALQRFATAVLIVWYPIKDRVKADRFIAEATRTGTRKFVDARLAIAVAHLHPGLTETGVLVINPPFTLAAELAILLPELAAVLALDTGSGHRISTTQMSA